MVKAGRNHTPGTGKQKRRLRQRSIPQMKARLRTILTREIDHLMDESWDKKLDAKNVSAIATYIRLVNELEQLEKIDLEQKKAEESKT